MWVTLTVYFFDMLTFVSHLPSSTFFPQCKRPSKYLFTYVSQIQHSCTFDNASHAASRGERERTATGMRCTHDNWVVPLTTLFLVYLSAAPEGKQCTVGKLTTLARSLAMFVCGGSKSRAFKSPQGPGPLPLPSRLGSSSSPPRSPRRPGL